MTKKEFERLKEGDKVRIVHKRTDGMNQMGDMDHWLGKVMTVAGRWDSGGIKMEEDRSERDDIGWYWGAEMIECKVSESIAYIEILTRENKTIAKSGKKVGTARRSSKDEADKAKGVIIAVARLCGYDVVTDEKGKVTLADKKKTVKASGEKEYELLSWDKAKKAVSGTKFDVDDLICGISESTWDRLRCSGKIASLSDEEQKRPSLRKMIAVCTGELRWVVPKCCVIEKKQGEKT